MITIQTYASEWQNVATFDELVVDMDIIINTAFHLAEKLVENDECFVQDVCVTDTETGEVFWAYQWDCKRIQNYLEPADIDNDCGFDPYLGCYTDDC